MYAKPGDKNSEKIGHFLAFLLESFMFFISCF